MTVTSGVGLMLVAGLPRRRSPRQVICDGRVRENQPICRRGRLANCVFHNQGRSIGDFERSRRTALVAVGLPDKHFHMQNMTHDCVPEVVTVSISGHQDALNGEDQRKGDARRLRLERGEFAESEGGLRVDDDP